MFPASRPSRGVVSCVALGLPGHPPKGVVPRYPPRGVLCDCSRPVPGSCRGVVSPLTGGFPHNNNRTNDEGEEDSASQVDEKAVVAAADSSTRPQAPMFTKHKHSRLFHVVALPAVATLVIAIRGPPNRQEKDALEDKVGVRAASVSDSINQDEKYDVPAVFANLGLDPSVHPHQRAGDKLQAEFQ